MSLAQSDTATGAHEPSSTPGKGTSWIAPLLLAAALVIYSHPGACAEKGEQEIDTQFIFGFTAGADVGELGEKEIEHETIARLGKRGGSYVGLSDQTRAEFVPVQNLRLELGLPIVYYDIDGVSGFDNVRRGAIDGIVLSARYKLLDHERSPFALTLGVEPHWARTDENTGERVENYGAELSIAADTALLKDMVFGCTTVCQMARQQAAEARRLRSPLSRPSSSSEKNR